jgi:hypothetical protein
MNPQSQTACILKGLNNGLKLTPLLALEFYGCLRLGARIYELKRMGHQIETKIITTSSGKRVAQYSKIPRISDIAIPVIKEIANMQPPAGDSSAAAVCSAVESLEAKHEQSTVNPGV